MDDFERELTRMMRDTRQPSPFDPARRQRLYAGIRARRRSRMLWRAGGSALAVTGLGIGLALLPTLNSGSPPADRPLPATTPSPPPSAVPAPTTSAPAADTGTSPPPTTTPPVTSRSGTTPPGGDGTPTSVQPSATADGSRRAKTTPASSGSSPPTTEQAREPSEAGGG